MECVTAVADRSAGRATRRVPQPLRLLGALHPAAYPIAVAAALNAAAFLVLRPDVNDLWAARARASAVQHGVGLTYWFSWFGGGSTPGNYSLLTPYVSAWTTAEVLGAVSAVAIPVLVAVLLRGTAHPVAGTALAAYTAGVNLWSGRVPFLFGMAFAVGVLIAVRHRAQVATILLTLLSIAASPVTGAFVAMGLSRVFVSHRDYRRISAVAMGTAGVGLITVGVIFGAPGPQPFSAALRVEIVTGLLLLLLPRPPVWLRTTIWLSLIAAVLLSVVPNGMGSNFARLVWFCLPVAVMALSQFRVWILTLVVLPLLVAGTTGTITDLRNAGKPISTVAYYRPLADKLDTIKDLDRYRVEVVNHGAHAAYDALLGHAMLARGWVTQEVRALNAAVLSHSLDATTYKVWLDNNAVGYVALPAITVQHYWEYDLVLAGNLPYLKLIWQSDDWKLFRVVNPTPVVAAPAVIDTSSQSQMTVDVPCACDINIRVRWSKFLSAAEPATGTAAQVSDDGSGWTRLTTRKPGIYVLRGTIGGLLR
jgi:hypothetical protein